MGLEDFGIFYISDTDAAFEKVRADLLSYGVVQSQPSDERNFYGIASQEYPLEILVKRLDTVASNISIRFALVNPPEIDDVFLDFVGWCSERWPGEITLMSSILMSTKVPSSRWTAERDLLKLEISRQRDEWFKLCGGESMKMNVSAAAALMVKILAERFPSRMGTLGDDEA